ncbi:MAG: TIGR04282 family arsenosugar biosynthesis glycosyltransferase [Bacteroidota bacterium]
MKQKDLLLIFVKHPEAGKTKTRLAAGIGQENALAIYQKLLDYTCSLARTIKADVQIWYGNQMPVTDLWSEAGFERYQQVGASLGDRMLHAFHTGFEQGYGRILIIGSDCATLTPEILNQGFLSLGQNQVVIGPARDGGYYLLGMRRLLKQLFYNKNWSTETVLSDTISDLQSANFSYHCLEQLSDVDTKDDLQGTFLEDFLASRPHPKNPEV